MSVCVESQGVMRQKNDSRKGRNEWSRILLISRDKSISSLACKHLSERGHDIVAFDNPLKAQLMFKIGYYDLALIDMNIDNPRISCFDLYRFIRALDENVKICFLTSFEINYKEFLMMFPSVEIDYLLDKSKASPDRMNKMYHEVLKH
jgi:two-component SAPR family response regulator